MDLYRLDELKEGEEARIVQLELSGGIRRRLQDIGMVKGRKVKCLRKSPLGDPTAYEICGAVIAIRCDEASKIFVSKGVKYGAY